MKLIVCLDEKQGMVFNHRRQSRDRLLIDNLEAHVQSNSVYITAYSEPLFAKNRIRYIVSDAPFSQAGAGDYCFIEEIDPAPYRAQIDELIIYHWNRHYPADTYFTLDMSEFQLIATEEFVGSSHEKITKEVWRR